MLLLQLHPGTIDAGSGVVNKDVEAAKSIADGVHELAHLTRFCKVRRHTQALDAKALHLLLRGARFLVVAEVVDDDIGAEGCKLPCNRAPDAPRPAGDQRNAAREGFALW